MSDDNPDGVNRRPPRGTPPPEPPEGATNEDPPQAASAPPADEAQPSSGIPFEEGVIGDQGEWAEEALAATADAEPDETDEGAS